MRKLARSHAARFSCLTEDQLDDLTVVVGELLTNCVQHSSSPEMTLAVLACAGSVRVEVGQLGHAVIPTSLRTADAKSTSGRGLGIVASLTSRRGVCHGPDTTTLWFEIDCAAGKAQ